MLFSFFIIFFVFYRRPTKPVEHMNITRTNESPVDSIEPPKDEESIRAREQAILDLGQHLCKSGKAQGKLDYLTLIYKYC